MEPTREGTASAAPSSSSAAELAAVPAIWLRDNCTCPSCRHPSGQKLHGILDLPPDVTIAAVTTVPSGFEVTFSPDGHTSSFTNAWLREHLAPPPGDGRRAADKSLWTGAELTGTEPAADWGQYLDEDEERLRALRAVRDIGFVLLTGTPLVPGTVLEIARSFGFVRETNYGELFEVRVESRPTNLAFSGHAITPHTDNPYRDPVPTLQLLHCLANALEGGESGLVDGFRAALALREEDRRAFETLSSTSVPFAWADDRASLRAERPLIGLDPGDDVREVRFNNRSMEPLRLPPGQLREFYRAYRRFAEIIARPEMMITFRLQPGDCVVFDNVRLLHSRTAFEDTAGGARHLQGCYADLDGLLSTIAVLEGAR